MNRNATGHLAAAIALVGLVVGASPAWAAGESASIEQTDCGLEDISTLAFVRVGVSTQADPAIFVITVSGVPSSIGLVPNATAVVPRQLVGQPGDVVPVTVQLGSAAGPTILSQGVTVPDCSATTPPTTAPSTTTPATTSAPMPTSTSGTSDGPGQIASLEPAVPTAVPAGEGPVDPALPTVAWLGMIAAAAATGVSTLLWGSRDH